MKLKRRKYSDAIPSSVVLVFLTGLLLITTLQGCATSPFSFVVVGDTRTESYLPGGPEQSEQMKAVLKKRYSGKPVSLFFDQEGLELTRVEVGNGEKALTLHYKEGWPHAIVETEKGHTRMIMRDTGRKWVFDRIVSTINRGAANSEDGALFLVHGGDISLFGHQGKRLEENPYWQLFDKELLSRLPLPPKKPGLPGRVLTAVGNHETWEDEEMSGLLTVMPWLKTLGLSSEKRIYSVSFRNCRFIFLDSGGYSTPEKWTSQSPPFGEQMSFLTSELKQAKDSGTDHVFIVYHKPSFVKVGHNPLPETWNPHRFIKPFATDLNIIVINSHTHTTEHYLVDGVHYLVLGAGGAPQKFDETTTPSIQEELYWKGERRVEEYNYLKIEVDGPKIRGFIHRFRPTETEKPLKVVEIIGNE